MTAPILWGRHAQVIAGTSDCTGNCNQGRQCSCARNEFAGEGQWESADAEVLKWLGEVAFKVFVFIALTFTVWNIGRSLGLLILDWLAA